MVSNTDCVSPKSDETGKDPSASRFLLLKEISVNVTESLFMPLKMIAKKLVPLLPGVIS